MRSRGRREKLLEERTRRRRNRRRTHRLGKKIHEIRIHTPDLSVNRLRERLRWRSLTIRSGGIPKTRIKGTSAPGGAKRPGGRGGNKGPGADTEPNRAEAEPTGAEAEPIGVDAEARGAKADTEDTEPKPTEDSETAKEQQRGSWNCWSSNRNRRSSHRTRSRHVQPKRTSRRDSRRRRSEKMQRRRQRKRRRSRQRKRREERSQRKPRESGRNHRWRTQLLFGL